MLPSSHAAGRDWRRRRRRSRSAPSTIAAAATMIGISAMSTEFEHRFQPLDVAAQRRLHVAQLPAGLHHLGAELLDRLGLLGRERLPRCPARLPVKFAQFRLGLLELAPAGRAPRRCSAPRRRAGSARRPRTGRAEVPRLRKPTRSSPPASTSIALATKSPLLAVGTSTRWPKNSCFCSPEPVVEHVGVGDDDDIDRLRRLLAATSGDGVGGAPARLGSSGLALRRFRRAVGKGGLGRAGDVGGQDVALVVRLELGKQAGDIGQPGRSSRPGSWSSRARS